MIFSPSRCLLIVIYFQCNFSRKLVKLYDMTNAKLPYRNVWNFQQNLLESHIVNQDNPITNLVGSLLVLQHDSVYTLGTGTNQDSGPFSTMCADGSILQYETFNVERAGQATYHGPGQLVLYPILDLNYFEKDINQYLRSLEQVVIDTCKDFGVNANRVDGLTGVWIGETHKIAAIGIKIRRWVTMHGLSLNCNPDMRYFSNIVPCGISDRSVCSLIEYNPSITVPLVSESLLVNFAKQFDIDYDASPSPENAFSSIISQTV